MMHNSGVLARAVNRKSRRLPWLLFWAHLALVLALGACGSNESEEEPQIPPGGGGNGGSGGGVEICDNGADDDGDGDVDCSDVSCGSRAPDSTAPTGFADSVSWLYLPEAGGACGPLQTGAADGALDPLRVAVMRGSVSDAEGVARPGARVSVVGAPELGSVLTRGDGMFDIAVNGGGVVTLEVRHPEFLRAHRHALVSPNDYAWVEPIALKPVAGRVTALSLGGASAEQVVRAEPSEDASGRRQPTLIVPANTQAVQQNADGTESPLSTLSVRITEYTVGERGPAAMPAELPPASAYTYAFELSVDEADAAGARGVAFDKPIPTYMENFLGFPTGTPVPVGFYNRETAAWEALEDGVVLSIVAEADGLASIDLDGDGLAEDVDALTDATIATEELAQLAALYEPGQSLWRTVVTHFSPYDHNWPFGFPGDAEGPPAAEPGDEPTDTPGCAEGSIIRVDNRSLGEELSVPGTGYSLFYQSDRTPGGHTRTIDVPVSEAAVPASLERIDVTLQIAGQQHQTELEPNPNQRFVFDWDGLNAYGFPIQGGQPFLLRVGYVYAGVYARSERADGRSFGQPGEIRLEGNRTREEVVSVREIRGVLGGWDARGQGLAGFTLDVHHVYDPETRTLLLGDGSQRTSETVPLSLVDVLAEFEATPDQVFVHPDGRVFITEDTNGAILQLQGGELVVFAGGGMPATGIGDGGPATEATLDAPQGMALGPDGSLYVAEGTRVRRIDPDGIISTFAGGGGGSFAEGEPATASNFATPDSLAFGPDGALYVAELDANRVRRVADGIVTTFAGTGSSSGELGDGGPALLAPLNSPSGLAFAPDGSLFISERFGQRIRRVAPDGVISTVAGTGVSGGTGDGGPATQATLATPRAIAFDEQGNLFISEQNGDRVRQIGPDGLITTLVDATTSDGALNGPDGIAVGPDGSVYVVSEAALLRVAQSLPDVSLSDIAVASADGTELYRFNRLGKHLGTIDTLTGVELRRFEHDDAGRLAAVVEDNRRTTRIERAANGAPTAIVSHYGIRTQLEVNPEGFLSAVTDAAGERVELEYATGGLLTRMLDERQGEHVYTYDRGRLSSDRDPTGAEQTFERSTEGDSLIVTRTTPLGRRIRHVRRRAENGGAEQRIEEPSGAVSVSVRAPNGDVSVSMPDGTQMSTRFGPDPRFGAMAPLNRLRVVTLPSGLAASASETRSATLADDNDPLSLSRLSTETLINDRAFLSEYDAASRTLVQTTPAGRQMTSVLDSAGRLAERRVAGLAPTFYEYDGDGRPSAIINGEGPDARRLAITYTADGWLAALTDPLGQSTQYTPDAVGRITRAAYADGSQVAFAYDPAGNRISLTPPGQGAHALELDLRNQLTRYLPPELPSGATPTSYVYDADRQLVAINLPGVDPISYTYDAAGLLTAVQHSGGTISLAYDGAARVISSQSPDGIALAYTYDGVLPTATSWSGPISGSIATTYDENFFVTGLSVNGQSTAFEYDADGLVTAAGALQLVHDPATALLTSSSVGDLDASYAYNLRGENTSRIVTGSDGPLYSVAHTYDTVGRVAGTTETVAAVTTTTAYTYDAAGRLIEVTTDGASTAAYSYDEDGNRLSVTRGGATESATYDAQERLLTHGDATYTYTQRGTLETSVIAGATTRYGYDALGNLTAVTLADGRNVTYLIDAENRRVGKRIDGALQRAWLYQDQLRPSAELDATGAVVSRFVYASKANVPDLMIQGGVTYGIISDLRGSVRLVVNTATSEVAQRIDYGPFGEVIADSNPGFQPFGFAGGLYDPDTSLVRFGARDYDAAVGRWTSKDPTRWEGRQPNLYAYVANDPINFVDPEGTIHPLVVIGVIALISGTSEYAFGDGNPEDFIFGAATGIIAGAGVVAGAAGAPLVALGIGANLIWNTQAGEDPGGVFDTILGCAGDVACEFFTGPAAPFACPFASEALENASKDLRE